MCKPSTARTCKDSSFYHYSVLIRLFVVENNRNCKSHTSLLPLCSAGCHLGDLATAFSAASLSVGFDPNTAWMSDNEPSTSTVNSTRTVLDVPLASSAIGVSTLEFTHNAKSSSPPPLECRMYKSRRLSEPDVSFFPEKLKVPEEILLLATQVYARILRLAFH